VAACFVVDDLTAACVVAVPLRPLKAFAASSPKATLRAPAAATTIAVVRRRRRRPASRSRILGLTVELSWVGTQQVQQPPMKVT
jgi:hypothetical protein